MSQLLELLSLIVFYGYVNCVLDLSSRVSEVLSAVQRASTTWPVVYDKLNSLHTQTTALNDRLAAACMYIPLISVVVTTRSHRVSKRNSKFARFDHSKRFLLAFSSFESEIPPGP